MNNCKNRKSKIRSHSFKGVKKIIIYENSERKFDWKQFYCLVFLVVSYQTGILSQRSKSKQIKILFCPNRQPYLRDSRSFIMDKRYAHAR